MEVIKALMNAPKSNSAVKIIIVISVLIILIYDIKIVIMIYYDNNFF